MLYKITKNKKILSFIILLIMISFAILTTVAKYEQSNTETNMIVGSVSCSYIDDKIDSGNTEECEDFILAVWHDYDSQESSDNNGANGRTTRFYTSLDGINFTEFNKDIYPLKVNSKENGGLVNNGWIGAPSLVYYNGLFFMVCSGNGVTPERDASIAVSKDLINWEWFDYTLGISSGTDKAKVAAPQLVVLDNKLYVIESVWCGETERDINDSIVYVYDSYMAEVRYDEKTGFSFGEPWILEVYNEYGSLSPNRNHIDSTIVQSNGIYYLLTKDDTGKNIELFTSKDLHEWELKNNQLFGANYFEAPTICNYNGVWHIYADRYASTRGMNKQIVHCTTTDFETFENYSLINTENEYQCRHGDVFTITDSEAKKILQKILDFQLSINEKEPEQQYFNLNGLKTVLYSQNGNVIEKKCTDFVSAFDTIYQIKSNNREYHITDLSNPFGLEEVTFEFSEGATNSTLIIDSSNGVELNYIYSPNNSDSEQPLTIKFSRKDGTNTLYPETPATMNSTKLEEIPGLTSKNTTFETTPDYWTNEEVKVKLSTIETGYTMQYSTDKINWTTYSKAVEISKNGTIYVCLYDGTNRGAYTSYTVSNIDTTAPILVVTEESTNKIIINASDELSGLKTVTANGKILELTNGQVIETVKVNTNYLIEATDNAGNTITQNVIINMKLGDLNNNNSIDTNDLLRIQRYIMVQQTGKNKDKWDLTEEEKIKADVNQDGIINTIDVLKIKRYIAASRNENIAQKHKDWLEI